MRVAISSNNAWSVYNFRYNLIKALKQNGHEIVIIAPYDKYAEKLKQEFEFVDIFIDNKGTNPLKDFKTFLNYIRVLKGIKPDVMLNFTIKPNIYGSMAAALLGIEVINNITGLGSVFISDNVVTKIVKFLYKISLYKSKKVFFQNQDDANEFIKHKLVNEDKIEVLPGSGVDVDFFKPIPKQEDGEFRFLLIARMLWDKGIGEYVEAAKIIKQKYKNVEFLLLGAVGVDNPTVIPIQQIKEWEKEKIVKYLGARDDVRREIANADCIVLPSYREGTSRVLLESAAMAKPIIATNVPGCNNIIDNKINGYLCKPKDYKDLAAKMDKMLNLTNEERVQMGKNGRKKIENEFDEKIVIRKYLKTIRELL